MDDLEEAGVKSASQSAGKATGKSGEASGEKSLVGLYDSVTKSQELMEEKLKSRDEALEKRLKPLEKNVEGLTKQVVAFKINDSLTKTKVVQLVMFVKSSHKNNTLKIQ